MHSILSPRSRLTLLIEMPVWATTRGHASLSIAVEMAAVVPESTPGTPASSDADSGASNSEGAGLPPSPVPIGRVVPTELKASIAVWDCGGW